MGFYGKQGYYLYARPTFGEIAEGQAFRILYDNDGLDEVDPNWSFFKITKIVPVSNSINRYEFVPFNWVDDLPREERTTQAVRLNPFPFVGITTAMAIVVRQVISDSGYFDGEATNEISTAIAAAAIRGPGYSDRIWTEQEASQVRYVSVGEISYDSSRHDLFNYTDPNRNYINTADPINPSFMENTALSPSSMNYTCIPIANRVVSAVPRPRRDLSPNPYGGCLITPWHLLVTPIGLGQRDSKFSEGGTVSFYDAEQGEIVTRTISGIIDLKGWDTSWQQIFQHYSLQWLGDEQGEDVNGVWSPYVWTWETIGRLMNKHFGGVPYPSEGGFVGYPGTDIPLGSSVSLPGPNAHTMAYNLSIAVLDSALPSGVAPASIPRYVTGTTPKIVYGVQLDKDARGFLSSVYPDIAYTASAQTSWPRVNYSTSYVFYDGSGPLSYPQYLPGADVGDMMSYGGIEDYSSVFMAPYKGKTLFLGMSSQLSIASVVAADYAIDDETATVIDNGALNAIGSNPNLHYSFFSGLSSRFWGLTELVLPPNPVATLGDPWVNDPYLLGIRDFGFEEVLNAPFLFDYVDGAGTPEIPDGARDLYSLLWGWVNHRSRQIIGASYPTEDVEVDIVDVIGDQNETYSWRYLQSTTSAQTIDPRPDSTPYYRAPRERASYASVRKGFDPPPPPPASTNALYFIEGSTGASAASSGGASLIGSTGSSYLFSSDYIKGETFLPSFYASVTGSMNGTTLEALQASFG